MTSKPIPGILAAMALCAITIAPATSQARLPSLDVNPWFGMFAAHLDRDMRFSFSDIGKVEIRPVVNDNQLGMTYIIAMDFQVRETRADGRVRMHTLVDESYASDDEPTTSPQKFTVRAKTKDDVQVEIVVERQRNGFGVGGRIVDPGSLAESQLEFTIRTRFRDFYYNVRDREGRTHQRNVRGDEARIRLTDGSRQRLSFNDEIKDTDALKNMNIAHMQINLHGYRGKTVEFGATQNARINIDKSDERPLTHGFHLVWTADPAKNADNSERLEIVIR